MNENNQTNTESTNNRSKITRLLTDENLYILCKRYGERALKWRRKFAGLLPEVNKRRLYEKKGFSSVFEFSKKLAGMSEEQVRLVLNLGKRFEKTPILKELLVNGKVSVNKLARIVSIAKPENEEFLAGQVQVLSKSAVETLVRDEKFEMENRSKNGLNKSFFGHKSLPRQTLNRLKLSDEVTEKLYELQNKGIDINELILEFLNKRNSEIANKKLEIVEELKEKEISNEISARQEIPSGTTKISITATQTIVSRYIPVKIKKIIHQEYGTKCSIPHCQKPATNLHHTQRFSLSKTHDPHFIAPLCHEHHLIAHAIDLNFHKKRP